MADLLERVRATGLLEPGRPVLVLLSGGRDSVCLLDVAVRITGAAHVEALHCRLRPARGVRRRRGALRGAVRAARRRAARAPPAAGPPAPGTCRPGRATSAMPRPPGSRSLAAATSPQVTPRPTRSRPCSTGSPRRPGGARCWGWPRATGGWCARCSAWGARRPPRTARRAGSPGARTPATTNRRSPATACAGSCCPRCARCTRPPRPTCCARSRCCATRRRCSTRCSTPRSKTPATRPRWMRCATCRPRCAGSRCSASPTAPPATGRRRSGTVPPRCWRSREGGALDVGGGLRAEVRGGALRFGASRGPAAPHPDPAPP